MKLLCTILIVTFLSSYATAKKVIVSREIPQLKYSFDENKVSRSANYLAYGKNAKICPELSTKANLILGYWITRQFRNTSSWQVTHNKAKGAFAFIEDDELVLVREVDILNPVAMVDRCTYTMPLDSLGYLSDFGNTYAKMGVGYVKIRYNVPGSDSLSQWDDAWEADVVLVLVE